MVEQQPENNIKQTPLAPVAGQTIDNPPIPPGGNPFISDGGFAAGIPPIPDPAPPGPNFSGGGEAPEQATDESLKRKVMPALKTMVWISAIIFVALLGGAGIFAFDYYFPSPARVMEKMFSAMSQAKTMGYEGKIGIEFDYSDNSSGASGDNFKENGKFRFGLDVSGNSDLRDAQRLKNSCSIKIAGNSIFEKGASVGIVSIGKIAYFKMNANNPAYDSLPGVFLSNQWIKVDNDKLAANMKQLYPQLADSIGKDAQKSAPLTPEQAEKIRALAKISQILVIENKLAEETVDGANCRHYAAKIDKEALKKFIEDAGEILKDKISRQNIELIADSAAAGDFSGIEVWVAKDDYTLRRFKGSMDAQYDFYGLARILYGIDIDMNYKKINQPVLIVAPEKSKSFESFFENILVGAH